MRGRGVCTGGARKGGSGSGAAQVMWLRRHARLRAKDVHQHPDAPVRRSLLDLGQEAGEGTGGQPHAITGRQTFGHGGMFRATIALPKTDDQGARHGGRFQSETHEPGDAPGRVDRAPRAFLAVYGHKKIAWKDRAQLGRERPVSPACFLIFGAERDEPLMLEMSEGDLPAIWFDLCQIPIQRALKRRHYTPLVPTSAASVQNGSNASEDLGAPARIPQNGFRHRFYSSCAEGNHISLNLERCF